MNVVIGYSGPSYKAILGIIVRDKLGNILGSGYHFHTWVTMVVMAEAVAVLHGLQFAQDMGFHRIILESDSWTVILKLQETANDCFAIRSLL